MLDGVLGCTGAVGGDARQELREGRVRDLVSAELDALVLVQALGQELDSKACKQNLCTGG